MLKSLFAFIAITMLNQSINAQCGTWSGLPNEDEIVAQHSVYREFVKSENYESAYEPWFKVYSAAPAADGRRDYHYTDGITILMSKFKASTDASAKAELSVRILKLYDEAIACYDNRSIKLKKSTDEAYGEVISSLYARKAYDMYYFLQTPYAETIVALQDALDAGGSSAEYTVISPYAEIAVYEFTNKNMTKERAREVHDDLLRLATANENNGNQYAAYYTQAKEVMLSKFKEIEDFIFDCDYFKSEAMDEYNSRSDDPLYAKDLYNELRRRGCAEDDEFLVKLKVQYEQYASEVNAQRQAEFEANNPAIMAKKAYDAGNYNEAINLYNQAINEADSDDKKASYKYSIASTLFRKLNKYGEARTAAREAANLRPGWGRPIALIGDMYAKTARSCGDSFNQRLAILAAYDKWAAAKSMEEDASFSADLSEKMGRYRSSFPTKDEGFMRGLKEGSSTSVACWIGENVSIRYQ